MIEIKTFKTKITNLNPTSHKIEAKLLLDTTCQIQISKF